MHKSWCVLKTWMWYYSPSVSRQPSRLSCARRSVAALYRFPAGNVSGAIELVRFRKASLSKQTRSCAWSVAFRKSSREPIGSRPMGQDNAAWTRIIPRLVRRFSRIVHVSIFPAMKASMNVISTACSATARCMRSGLIAGEALPIRRVDGRTARTALFLMCAKTAQSSYRLVTDCLPSSRASERKRGNWRKLVQNDGLLNVERKKSFEIR